MSNASSPRQGGPSPSSSTANQLRYNPYQKHNGVQMVRPMMMPQSMCAVAPNGQMIMANQLPLGGPAQLQARLGTPYMMGGGMQLMPCVSNNGLSMTAGMTAGMIPTGGQIMMASTGQMIQAAPGQIQVQYVQPPIQSLPGHQTHGVSYSSQPVTYASQTSVQPPPPPQGNPPSSTAEQTGNVSRSSTPQTKGNSETGIKLEPYNPMGPDFNHENDRLQSLVKDLRTGQIKLEKDNQKLREKVKKLSRENHAATKSYTVKDGKCPFCTQDMPSKRK